MKIIGKSTGIKIRSYDYNDLNFNLYSSPVDTIVVPAYTQDVVVKDQINHQSHTATVDHTFNVSSDAPVTFSSLTPEIATIDSGGGYVQRVASGTTLINAETYHLTKQIFLHLSRTNSVMTSSFLDYVDGSLAKHCCDSIGALIAGYTQSTVTAAQPIYTTLPWGPDDTGAVYVRNPNCWLNSIVNQLTCMSPWNSLQGHNRAGTLISPRHVAFAQHYYVPAGYTMRFVNTSNQVFTYTVTGNRTIYYNETLNTDINIGCLDRDVDSSISFTKVLPANWSAYLPTLTTTATSHFPMITTNQYKQCAISDVGSVNYYDTTQGSLYGMRPTDTQRKLFYLDIISGDSGSPAFLFINNQLVMVTAWTWGGAGGGPFYGTFVSKINDAMTSLGGGYQLTPVDLSGFNTYSAFLEEPKEPSIIDMSAYPELDV